VQDRVDAVLEPRALAHDVRAAGDLGLSAWVSSSGSHHEGRKPAARSWASTWASTLSVFTFASAIALVFAGFETTTRGDVPLQEPRDRMGVASRLERHLVGGGEALGDRPQLLRRRLQLPRRTHDAVFPDGHLGELAMDVEHDAPSDDCLLSSG
jgi:hypothetical protein